jgi:hypothetical protein
MNRHSLPKIPLQNSRDRLLAALPQPKRHLLVLPTSALQKPLSFPEQPPRQSKLLPLRRHFSVSLTMPQPTLLCCSLAIFLSSPLLSGKHQQSCILLLFHQHSWVDFSLINSSSTVLSGSDRLMANPLPFSAVLSCSRGAQIWAVPGKDFTAIASRPRHISSLSARRLGSSPVCFSSYGRERELVGRKRRPTPGLRPVALFTLVLERDGLPR